MKLLLVLVCFTSFLTASEEEMIPYRRSPLPLVTLDRKPQVMEGSITMSQNGDTLVLTQTSHMAIVEWCNFSLGPQETVEFHLPSSEASVLIRATGWQSNLEGTLQSNGSIYLINQKGIQISGNVKAGEFLASSIPVTDQEYLSDGALLFSGDSQSGVHNSGTIIAQEGNLFLIGPDVSNAGSLKSSTGHIGLASSSEIFLCTCSDQKIWNLGVAGTINQEGSLEGENIEIRTSGSIRQSGEILASGTQPGAGKLVLSAVSLEASGSLKAHSENGMGGEIHLLGEEISIMGQALIDASGRLGGGVILVGGDYQGQNSAVPNAKKTLLEKGAILRADALETGSGGKIILFATEKTSFSGFISAEGGKFGGNGGLVEVFSPGMLHFEGSVSLFAPFGELGTLHH